MQAIVPSLDQHLKISTISESQKRQMRERDNFLKIPPLGNQMDSTLIDCITTPEPFFSYNEIEKYVSNLNNL